MKKIFVISTIILSCLIQSNQGIAFSDKDPNAKATPIPSEDMFDLIFEYPCAIGGGEAGIETDGIFFYTTKWNGNQFYKYDINGTFIDSLTIPSVSIEEGITGGLFIYHLTPFYEISASYYFGESEHAETFCFYDVIDDFSKEEIKVTNKELSGTESLIDMNGLPSGIYFLKIQTKNAIFNQKIILQ